MSSEESENSVDETTKVDKTGEGQNTEDGTSTKENSTKESEDEKLAAEKPKEQPRKRHKEDFDWEDDIIGNGAFGEVCIDFSDIFCIFYLFCYIKTR